MALCAHHNPDVTRNAAAALGNLAYACPENQQIIGEQGGVHALITLCKAALAREGLHIQGQQHRG